MNRAEIDRRGSRAAPFRVDENRPSFKFDRLTIQPKIDFFNLLNRAPVTAILGLNYGTAAYNQPSVVLNPRTFQLGAIVRF